MQSLTTLFTPAIIPLFLGSQSAFLGHLMSFSYITDTLRIFDLMRPASTLSRAGLCSLLTSTSLCQYLGIWD